MAVAVMRTKAEQAYTDQFESVAARLPGGPAVVEARKAAILAFGGLGLPHRRIEEFKYSDLRTAFKDVPPPAVQDETAVTAADLDAALGSLAGVEADRVVFVNGRYRPELSRIAPVQGIDVKPLGATLTEAPHKVAERLTHIAGASDALAQLNTAYMTDGAIVRVAEGVQAVRPLLLVFAGAGSGQRMVTTRNVLSIGAGAHVTVCEAFVKLEGAAGGQSNTLTDIAVGDGAAVTHVKALMAGHDTHLATWIISLGAGTAYRGFQFTESPGLARNQMFVLFQGSGAKLDLSGAFMARGSEHIDTTLVVDHAEPGCESRELFKGVLDGAARGVFQGKIVVRQKAQKTDGKQMAQALMLSENAEFDSKPELEIYADDVACGHGSTSAQLDPDLVFYCRARGIPEAEARALLTESFIGEAIDRVEDAPLREALMASARRWLRAAG
ncbi:MAG: Fe-S cluster assembly protein SufD [Hyphomicrobiaceae bacterium]